MIIPSAVASGGDGDLFVRARGNPLLTAQRWPLPVNAVLNPAATTVDGVTILLCRVEDRRGISELTVARSTDGVTNWVVDPTPLLSPSTGPPQEAWGVEDPRITRVDELDCWVIAYTAFGPQGPAVALATTRDFTSVRRLGVVCTPEDKNAALLPRRAGGDFILFHRPVSVIGGRPGVWLSRSTDLHGWAAPEPVFGPRPGGWWDSASVGIGPPPIETPEGWLVIYHGVRDTVAGALYRVGLLLLDLDNPTIVRTRSPEWVLGPTEPYELTGNVPGVVFPTGLTHHPITDELRLYYGAANTCIALATVRLADVLAHLLADPHHPSSAHPVTGAIPSKVEPEATIQIDARGTDRKKPPMTATDPGVISGPPHTVIEVDGRPPTGLAGCIGNRTLTLVRNGLAHRIQGTGAGTEHSDIRFQQKDLGPEGRDVRVWKITHPGDDVLLAQHCPTSEPPAARPDPRTRSRS